jgi:hypothetical protein
VHSAICIGYDQASRRWEDNIKMDLTKIGYELVLVNCLRAPREDLDFQQLV